MIVQQELLKKIKDFGLNSYEAKIWTALLSRGISSAGELSDISNVPRSRTYDVLESLEKKGFVMMKLGKPIKYMAISPTEVIEGLKKKIKEESLRQEAQMEDLKKSSVLQELTVLHNNGIEMVEPNDLVGMIKDRKNIYDYLENMMKKSEESIHIVTSSAGFQRKIEEMGKTINKLIANKISVKVLLTDGNADKFSKEYKDIEFKSSDVNSRFILIDGKKLIFFITDDKETHESYDTAVWVEASFFAESLKSFFEMAWKKNK